MSKKYTKNAGKQEGKMLIRAVFFILAVGAGWYLWDVHEGCVKDYKLINRYLKCDYEPVINKKGYSEFKFELHEYISKAEKDGEADIIAVWFRDLEFGPTFGINDRKDFIPASLLKLPLALTYFSLAEDDPEILAKPITYSKDVDVLEQTFAPENPLEKNSTYTVAELIYNTLAYSDNVAGEFLYEYLIRNHNEAEPLRQTYRDLGILDPGDDYYIAGVNVKGYGSIFRMLYNASFLNKEYSEKLLQILSEAQFKDGLRMGVPVNIKIAHKFGERWSEDGQRQLHDCGIVYYPENPYQLCIMTKGDDFKELQRIIGEISKMVYEEFDSRKL